MHLPPFFTGSIVPPMSLNSQICLSIENLHFPVWNELRTFGGFRRSVLLRFVGSHCAGNFSLWCSLWQDWLVTGQKAPFRKPRTDRVAGWAPQNEETNPFFEGNPSKKSVTSNTVDELMEEILHHLIGYPIIWSFFGILRWCRFSSIHFSGSC